MNDMQGMYVVHIQPPAKDNKTKNDARQQLRSKVTHGFGNITWILPCCNNTHIPASTLQVRCSVVSHVTPIPG